MIKKVDGCKNNAAKSSLTKLGEIPCGYSIPTIWTIDGIENRHDEYRGKDCLKKFCESSTEHAVKIINFEKKNMIPLLRKEYESCLNQINCCICKKSLKIKTILIKTIVKSGTIIIIKVTAEVMQIVYVI